MDRYFDQYLDRLSEPLMDAPAPAAPVEVPMEKTVLVDIAEKVENPTTYIDEGEVPKFQQRKNEGITTLAPPVDVYEPGFREDVVAGLKEYFAKQKRIRDNNERIRRITGIGRTF